MCTNLTERFVFEGSAKGRDGWFAVRQLYLGYDHPAHAEEEHAVLVDLVDESRPGARVAIELSPASARQLARQLLVTAAAADHYEAPQGASGFDASAPTR